jgi:plastocyanin
MRPASSLLACAGSAAALLSATFVFSMGGSAKTATAANPTAPAIVAVAPAQEGGFGTIKGRLVYGGDKAPDMPQFDTKAQPFCADLKVLNKAVEVDPKTKGVANGLVWINGPKGKNAAAEKALLAKTPKVKIDNKDCEFVPRTTAMMKGQALEFTSSDAVGHNSHVTGFTYSTNQSLSPKGSFDAPKVVAEKRPMNLKCDIHGWMQGWVLVCDHPFFAVTNKDGSFEITGVPAGSQSLIIWQEKAGFVSAGAAKGQPVEVKAGGTVDLGDVVLDPTKIKK